MRRLFESEEREGKRTILRDAPKVFEDVRWIWRAYGTLSAARSRGARGQALPIAITEIESYARLLGIDGASAVELLEVIVEMDRSYMKFVESKEAEQARLEEAQRGRRKPQSRSFGG